MFPYFNSAAKARPEGTGVNAPLNKEGKTALHLAVARNDEKTLRSLMRVNANPNQQDKEGQSPLFDAIKDKNMAMVTLLAEKGASFELRDDEKRSALDWAIECECDIKFIEGLRQLGANPESAAPAVGRTAMHLAAEKNRPDLIEYLFNSGHSISAQDKEGDSPLHLAVAEGAEGAIRKLLQLGADPILRNNQIETPLHIAAEEGNAAIVDILLEEQAVRRTINDFKTYSNGYTPLMAAVAADKPGIVAKIAAVGGDVNQTDNHQHHSLYIAVTNGHVQTARALLELGADTTKPSPRGYSNASIVHEIAAKNYPDMLLLLYGAGFDVNAKDHAGDTPLNKACDSQNQDKIKALLALGANPNIANNYGRRALDTIMDHYSYSYTGHPEIIAMLLSKGADPNMSPIPAMHQSPLHIAARNGNMGTIEKLLAANARIDQPDRSDAGVTPFMAALEGGRDAVAEMLGKKGANIFRKDKFKRGALMLAAKGGAKEALEKLLLIPGIAKTVNDTDHRGQTALHQACINNNHDIIAPLLKAGAKADVFDNDGMTALHRAIENSYMADFLDGFVEGLGVNADWNQPTKSGDTPLHVAIKNTQQPVLERLLELGANPAAAGAGGISPLQAAVIQDHEDIFDVLLKALIERDIHVDIHRDDNGWTALHYAAIQNGAGMATKLVDAGADMNARTKDGDTALIIAAMSGQQEVVDYLLSKGADIAAANDKGQTALDHAVASKDASLVQSLLREMQRREMPLPDFSPKPPKPAAGGPTP